MSEIRVNNIIDEAGTGAPTFPNGAIVTGSLVATATTATTATNATGLSGTPNITVGTVTGTNATFSGNLTVNGTTTTIDTAVTSVDSLAVDGLTTSSGFQATGNTTPSTGSGVEIFKPSATEGRIQTYDRGGTAWMDLRLKGQSITLSNDSADVLSIDANRTTKFKGPLTEKCNRDTGAGLTGDYNHDLISHGNVHWATSNSSGTWTYNLRGSASVALNDMMNDGETLSFQLISAQNNTSNYMTAFKIDGSSSHLVWWQGGSAPTAGNASGYDVYTFTVFKIGNASFRTFAALSNHA